MCTHDMFENRPQFVQSQRVNTYVCIRRHLHPCNGNKESRSHVDANGWVCKGRGFGNVNCVRGGTVLQRATKATTVRQLAECDTWGS